MRPRIWGGGRLHHVECGAQRRPRHWTTRLRASEAPATRGGGEREAEAEFESASEEWEEVGGPDAGRTECFSFLCFYFLRRPGGKALWFEKLVGNVSKYVS